MSFEISMLAKESILPEARFLQKISACLSSGNPATEQLKRVSAMHAVTLNNTISRPLFCKVSVVQNAKASVFAHQCGLLQSIREAK